MSAVRVLAIVSLFCTQCTLGSQLGGPARCSSDWAHKKLSPPSKPHRSQVMDLRREGMTASRVCALRGGCDEGEPAVQCVGQKETLERFERQFQGNDENTVVLNKLQQLKAKYPGGYRRVKGDGNCFLRGYVFGIFEELLGKESTEASGFKGILTAYYFLITDKTNGLGYSVGAIEDFYNDIQNLVCRIEDGTMTPSMLEDNFNEVSLSNAVIFFCRLVCSCYIQQHPEHFAPFLGIETEDKSELQKEVKKYCLREVEPLDREVDQEQVIALTSALKVGVRVEYLDRSAGGLNHHDFPHGEPPSVHLLYRPGHYDLIYPTSAA